MRSNSHFFKGKDPIPEEAKRHKDPTSNPYSPPFFGAKSTDDDPSTAPSLYDVAGQFLDPRKLGKKTVGNEERERNEKLAHVVIDPVTKQKVISFPNAEDPQVRKAKDREEGRTDQGKQRKEHPDGPDGQRRKRDSARAQKAKAADLSEEAKASEDAQEIYQKQFEELLPPTRHHFAGSAYAMPIPSNDIKEYSGLLLSQTISIVLYTILSIWLLCCLLRPVYTVWLVPAVAYFSIAVISKRADFLQLSTTWDSERQRGESFRQQEKIPESVEWLNGFIGPLWPLINSELFVGLADTLEDVLQAQLPKVVYAVRVERIDQGGISPRILAVKVLTDALDKEDQRALEETTGEYVNIELSFAYVSKVTKNIVDASSHAHLLMYLTAGLKDVVGVDLPILVELKSVIGTMRARIELQPDPPFLRNATVTLIGLPKFDVVVKPLKGFDVMDIPPISNYVLNALNIAASELVAPKSFTMNLGKMITSDTTQKDTQCIGIIVVSIHRGIDLRSEDIGGKSDPYVTISYARFGKPLFSTRVIVGELQPYWEETCFVKVSRDTVREGESIRATLWDSDRFTVDDALGKVEIDLYDLMRDTNLFKRRQDTLLPVHKGSDTQGILDWSIGYFSKMRLQSNPGDLVEQAGIKSPKIQQNPNLANPRLRAMQEEKACSESYAKEWPSGILAVRIEHIQDMIIMNHKRSNRRPRLAGRSHYSSNDPEKYPTTPQNGYVMLILNDEVVYRTRTKSNTNNPVFNAATEVFVRDIEVARVIVVVKCAVNREPDPIVGIVALKLRDLFVQRSQISRAWPLVGGVGFGHIHLSFLWKSVEMQLPRELRGFNVGVVQVFDIQTKGVKVPHGASIKLQSGEVKMSIAEGEEVEEGGYHFAIKCDSPVKIPIRHRYPSNLVLSLECNSLVGRSIIGKSVVWLRNLLDREIQTLTLPLYQSDDWHRLEQNSLTGIEGKSDGQAPTTGMTDGGQIDRQPSDRSQDLFGMQRIGYLEMKMVFKPGIGLEHYDMTMVDKRLRDCFNAWEIASDSDDWRKSGTARAAKFARVSGKAGPALDEATPEVIENLMKYLKETRNGEVKDVLESESSGPQNGESHIDNSRNDLIDKDPGASPTTISPTSPTSPGATRTSPVMFAEKSSIEKPSTQSAHHRDASRSTARSSDTLQSNWSTIHDDSDKDSHTLYDDQSESNGKNARRRKFRRRTGAMQWGTVRTGKWLKDGLRHRMRGLVEKTKLKGRVPDIETEV